MKFEYIFIYLNQSESQNIKERFLHATVAQYVPLFIPYYSINDLNIYDLNIQ